MNSFQFFANTTLFNDKRQNHYKEPWVSWTQGKGIDYNLRGDEKRPYQYFTCNAVQDCTFKMTMRAADTLYYSIDNGKTWTGLESNVYTPTVQAGKSIMFKMSIPNPSVNGIGQFTSTGNHTVEGNIMSLLYGDNFVNQRSLQGMPGVFALLFMFNTKLLSAENLVLPATTLSEQCYQGMFSSCTSLVKPPKSLPATTLTANCYNAMFQGCTRVQYSPVLPATNLVTSCYESMFTSCSSLTYVKCLATNISATDCIKNFLSSIGSTGTFVKNPSTPASTWSNELPSGWTIVDNTD